MTCPAPLPRPDAFIRLNASKLGIASIVHFTTACIATVGSPISASNPENQHKSGSTGATFFGRGTLI